MEYMIMSKRKIPRARTTRGANRTERTQGGAAMKSANCARKGAQEDKLDREQGSQS